MSTRAEIRATRDEMRGSRESRQTPISGFELREVPNGTGGTNLRFEGYASVTCADETDVAHVYEMQDLIGEYTEGIVRGAFAKTLREGCDTNFVVNHGGVSMARTKPGTLQLFEDNTGLNVAATLNPARSDVQILRAAIEDGAIDEMSFSFRVLQQRWSYVEENGVVDRRWIKEIDLNKGDVSAVNFGANDLTGGLVSIRNRVLGGPSPAERLEPARRRRETPVLADLPDYTSQARLDLAKYLSTSPIAEARRALLAARRRTA